MNKYDDANCCKESAGLVFWHPKGEIRRLTARPNPLRTGWCMSVDDESIVNVAFCPFCGTKLTEVEAINAQRNDGAQ